MYWFVMKLVDQCISGVNGRNQKPKLSSKIIRGKDTMKKRFERVHAPYIQQFINVLFLNEGPGKGGRSGGRRGFSGPLVEWANGQPVDIYIMSIFFSNEFLKPIGGRRMGGGAQSQMVFGEDYLFYFKLRLSQLAIELWPA